MEVSKLWTRKTRIVSQDRRFKMLRRLWQIPLQRSARVGFYFALETLCFHPTPSSTSNPPPKNPHNLAKSSGASTVSPQKKKSPSQSTKQHHRFTCRQSSASPNFGHVHRKKKENRKKKIKLPNPRPLWGTAGKDFCVFPEWIFRELDATESNERERIQTSWRISLRRRLKQPLEKHPLPQRKQNVFQSLLWSSLCGSLLGWSILLLCVFKSYFYKRCTLLCQKGKILSQKKEKAQKRLKNSFPTKTQ